ncbi:MAG: hypothetical protein ACRD6N_18665, partial [Pyrinomonadaceae bacterium]
QCGSAIPAGKVGEASEQPTALFTQTSDTGTTQRLDPRTTSPDHARMSLPSSRGWTANTFANRGNSHRWFVIGVVTLAVLIVGIACVVAIVRIKSHSRTTSTTAVLYPGAQTVVDMTNEDGGRAIQLQTTDSLDQVESWYQKNLKPTKVVRLAATSIVLKNENTTATLAREDDKTNILIKIAR